MTRRLIEKVVVQAHTQSRKSPRAIPMLKQLRQEGGQEEEEEEEEETWPTF